MSMSRRRNKKANKLIIFSLLFLFVCALPAVLIHWAMASLHVDPTVVITVILFIAGLIGGFIFIFFLPSIKGRFGEARVNRILNCMADKYDGRLIYDVIIPGEDGKTSQIDHILVCTHGLFVIETKNYAGRIYGSESQHDWTQVLAYGRSKNKLYNPLMQNYTHIRRLKELLPEWAKPIGAVVFVRGNIEYIDAKGVYSLRGLKRMINGASETLSANKVNVLADKIQHYKDNPVTTSKEHVKSIKDAGKKLKSGICPRCGGELVLRISKNDGSKFWGCSNYPKCTFHTKELEK